MILERNRLASIFKILNTSVGNKILKIADYVQFRLHREERKLFISTTDINSYMTVDYGDLGITDIDDVKPVFLLPFKLLNSIIQASTTEIVDFSMKGDSILLKTNGEYELPTYVAVDDFPIVDFAFDKIAKIEVTTLLSHWEKAAIAISEDVTKIAYQGVNFDGNFVGSDNRRLSVAKTGIQYSGDSLLLMKNFGAILKVCRNEVVFGSSPSKKMVVLVCEEIGLVAAVRLIDAKFANYRDFVGNNQVGIKLKINKSEIVGVISRLMILTDLLYKVVEMKINVNCKTQKAELQLSVHHSLGIGNEKIAIKEYELGGDYQLSSNREEEINLISKYNLDNVYDGIVVTESSDEIVLNIQPSGKLFIQEDNYTYLLVKIVE